MTSTITYNTTPIFERVIPEKIEHAKKNLASKSIKKDKSHATLKLVRKVSYGGYNGAKKLITMT
jgi:hypothetical protein